MAEIDLFIARCSRPGCREKPAVLRGKPRRPPAIGSRSCLSLKITSTGTAPAALSIVASRPMVIELIEGWLTCGHWAFGASPGPVRVVIGTAVDCHWRVAGPGIAAHHLHVHWTGDALWVAPAGQEPVFVELSAARWMDPTRSRSHDPVRRCPPAGGGSRACGGRSRPAAGSQQDGDPETRADAPARDAGAGRRRTGLALRLAAAVAPGFPAQALAAAGGDRPGRPRGRRGGGGLVRGGPGAERDARRGSAGGHGDRPAGGQRRPAVGEGRRARACASARSCPAHPIRPGGAGSRVLPAARPRARRPTGLLRHRPRSRTED